MTKIIHTRDWYKNLAPRNLSPNHAHGDNLKMSGNLTAVKEIKLSKGQWKIVSGKSFFLNFYCLLTFWISPVIINIAFEKWFLSVSKVVYVA